MENKLKIIYVTGISGTGKSTLVKEFIKRGLVAFDVDEFAHWQHKESGERNHWEAGKSIEFLNTHEWICDIDELKKEFEKHKNENVFVFGIVDKEPLKLFDKVILLTCSIETAFKRIDQRDDNDFGKGETEREWMKSWHDDFERDWIAKGAIPVNAEDSVEVVIENILNICK